MYMLPNLPFLTLFFYSIPLPFGPHSEDGISQNSAPLEAKRVFIWTRGVRNLITPSEVACPEFDICMCSMYDAQRPTSTACKITSSLSDRHGSRQKPRRQFFFPATQRMTRLGRLSPSLSPSPPTFVPLMMIDVGPNGLTRIWTHPPTTPKPPFPRPGYFSPPVPRSELINVCVRLSKDADNALIHAPRSPPINFLHPHVKFHLPPPL